MFSKLSRVLISRAEKRLGVKLDYVHQIAQSDIRLLLRYNKIFGFLDPRRHASPLAYHCARLRGAIAADCGTCVEAEINLALKAGLRQTDVQAILSEDYANLSAEISAIARLADAVVANRTDSPQDRQIIIDQLGEKALIELAFAMNGASLLPGIKRTLQRIAFNRNHKTRQIHAFCDVVLRQVKREAL